MNKALDSGSRCPLCDTPLEPWINVPGDWQRPHAPETFTWARCPLDGLGQLQPMPSPETIERAYLIDDYYTRSDSRSLGDVKRGLSAKVLEKLALLFDRGSGPADLLPVRLAGGERKRVLDIGCGSGRLLGFFADQGHDVSGIEPDDNASSRQPGFGHRVFKGTAEAIPIELADERFDFIAMRHVMEHSIDALTALQNVRALLAPDGVAYIEVPNAECIDFRWEPLAWPHLETPRHTHMFTGKTLSQAALKAGLETDQTFYLYFMRQMVSSWRGISVKMRAYNRTKGAAAFGPKALGLAYYWALFARTAFAARRLKYDSVALLVRKAR